MSTVLILGGGFGGLAAAHRLRQNLAQGDEIILVDQGSHFMVGFRKTWALVGESTLEMGQRPLAEVSRHGIQLVSGTVTRIDPGARAVEVDGRRLEADAVIVALGAQLAPEAIPGFEAHAHNVYDPRRIPAAAQALREFAGGKVMIGVFGLPYKCPPAPYEIALLVSDFFRARGARVSLEVFTPQPMSLPIVGQSGCDVIEGRLADSGVTFLPNHKATAVEAGEVAFTTGRRPFDLLLGIPPHRAPAVVEQSGLTGAGGWVEVDPRTLETRFPGVYAIGDVVHIPTADGKALPKAGIFAEAMGEVVADCILASLRGQTPRAVFAGEGGCFLEVGRGEAMMVRGNFLAQPAPDVTLTEPSREYVAEKQAFEARRLQAWFA